MPDIFEMVVEPDERLHTASEEVRDITSELKKNVEKMKRTVEKQDGVGLAAVQVGIMQRFALVCFEKGEGKYEKAMLIINPKITSFSSEMVEGEEGCLSIPGFFTKVWRHKRITLEYTDIKGEKQVLEISDWNARIVQHEIDHLNGILITDRMERQNLEPAIV